jgi:integrase
MRYVYQFKIIVNQIEGFYMTKGTNYNHPKKGSTIKVEPIRSLQDIEKIKVLLAKKPLYYAAFVVGINTNLRASDLLSIKASQVIALEPMDEITLVEKKTGKHRRINLNLTSLNAIRALLATRSFWRQGDYLFTGQRGRITVECLNQVIKKVCKEAGLVGNYGSHTLRKTWAYHQRVTFHAQLPEIMIALNHSSQSQTLSYLCIQPEELREMYSREL